MKGYKIIDTEVLLALTRRKLEVLQKYKLMLVMSGKRESKIMLNKISNAEHIDELNNLKTSIDLQENLFEK